MSNPPSDPATARRRCRDDGCAADKAFFYALAACAATLVARLAIVHGTGPYDRELYALTILYVAVWLLVAKLIDEKCKLSLIAALIRAAALVKMGTIAIVPLAKFVFYLGRNWPLRDDLFARIDHALGFDWTWYAGLLATRPTVVAAMHVAYFSIWQQPVLIGLVLIASGQVPKLYAFCAAQTLGIFATVVAATLTPAVGAYAQFHADYPLLRLFDGDVDRMTAPLLALRAGDLAAIADAPLVQFPSYHAAAALLYVWAAWGTVLRWPCLALNVAMVASAPLLGSHYAIDLVVGLAYAVVCIEVCRTMVGRPEAPGVRRLTSQATIGAARRPAHRPRPETPRGGPAGDPPAADAAVGTRNTVEKASDAG